MTDFYFYIMKNLRNKIGNGQLGYICLSGIPGEEFHVIRAQIVIIVAGEEQAKLCEAGLVDETQIAVI